MTKTISKACLLFPDKFSSFSSGPNKQKGEMGRSLEETADTIGQLQERKYDNKPNLIEIWIILLTVNQPSKY